MHFLIVDYYLFTHHKHIYYKHLVLGLIFLKYVSVAFEERREELRGHFRNSDHDFYIPLDDMSARNRKCLSKRSWKCATII